jgi:hypothetical protein
MMVARLERQSAQMPAVTHADAIDDRDWFGSHKGRRYRVRRSAKGWWIVRKRTGGVMLRTWVAELPPGDLPDTDKALRPVWFDAAWGELTPLERAELVCAAVKSEA